MKSSILVAALVLGVLFASCDKIGNVISPSGKITSDTLKITGFTGISVEDAFEVTVYYVDTLEKVIIHANDNLHPFIVVNQQSEVLEIKIEKNTNVTGNATLQAIVYTKNIKQFYASGASQIIVHDPITQSNVYVDLSGASHFKSMLKTDKLSAVLSGASVMEIRGTSNNININMSGASATSNYDFATNHFEGDYSGSSTANITVNNSIKIDASGASVLKYKGNAEIIQQNLSGGSSVKKVN